MATTSSLLRQMSEDYAPACESHVDSLSSGLFWSMADYLDLYGTWDTVERKEAYCVRSMEYYFHRLHNECDLEWNEVLAIQARLASDLYLL